MWGNRTTGNLALQQVTNDRNQGTSHACFSEDFFPSHSVHMFLVNIELILEPNLGFLLDSIALTLHPEKKVVNRQHVELGKGIPRRDIPPIQVFMHFRWLMFGKHWEQAVQTRITHSVDTARQGKQNRGF